MSRYEHKDGRVYQVFEHPDTGKEIWMDITEEWEEEVLYSD